MEFFSRLLTNYILLAIPICIFVGYMVFTSTLLDLPGDVQHTTSICPNGCEVILSNSSVDKLKSLYLDKSQALFVHFMGNNLSRLQPPEYTEILDPVNLVWVEDITAPFLSLDLGFNIYSFTTLWRKVRNISVTVEFGLQECLESFSCITASLATAFLTDVSQQRGALCYVVNSLKYKCCQKNNSTQKIECDIPALMNPQMSGVFISIIIVATIFFVCFPAFFIRFPDELDSLQTRSANVQVRNPLYRIANFVVQELRHYSTKYYPVNVINNLLIGCSLPILFYIDWGMILYTAKYDIPKMFNNAVKKNWLERNLFGVLFATVAYNIVVLFISLFPRTEKLNFSSAPVECQEKVQILAAKDKDFEVDWTKPFSFARKLFVKFCFGFKGLRDGQTFLCGRIIKLVLSFLLILVLFPVSVPFIFIGYAWYISPLGRKMNLFFYHAHIYILWLRQRNVPSETSDEKWFEKFPWFIILIIRIAASCIGIIIVIVLIILMVILMTLMLSFAIIVSKSLLLISRLITYLCMGIVASKDDFLPTIALFSLFVFYIWNCFSSVGHTYKDLLDQTFKKCKKYQEKENKQIIIVDDEGAPRIPRLSVLFQKVVDKIHPFSKAYTIMCVRIAIIWSFLFLTYFAILVYGKTSLNDVTKTVAVSLAGLIPKLIEIFRSGNSKDFIKSDNAYRVGKIVQEFFDSGNGEQEENGGTSERSTRNGTGIESPHSRLVRADVNPRLADINGDPSNETTPLLQSHRNTSSDIIVV